MKNLFPSIHPIYTCAEFQLDCVIFEFSSMTQKTKTLKKEKIH